MGETHRNAVGRKRWLLIASLVTLTSGAACAHNRGPRELAHDDMMSLVLDASSGTRVLSLVAKPGVKINARLQPSIDRGALPAVVFDAPGRTADSTYFVMSPTASIDDVHPLRGTLRASACPEGKRVCLSVALPVDLP